MCTCFSLQTRLVASLLVLSLLFQLIVIPADGADRARTPQNATATDSHPATRVYRVSPEEFRLLEPLLQQLQAQRRAQIIEIAQQPSDSATGATTGTVSSLSAPLSATNTTETVTNDSSGASSASPIGPATNAPAADPAAKRSPPPPSPAPAATDSVAQADHGDGFADFLCNLCSGDWGDGNGAVVIYVVIGVAVVAAVVVYATAFLVEALTGTGQHRHWWDLAADATFLTGDGNRGSLSGARVSAGLENRAAKIGLVLDGGRIDARVRTRDSTQPLNISGGYVMAGTAVRWQLDDAVNPSCFGIELLAGTASAQQVGLISEARATLTFGIGNRARLGLSLGALYLGLKATDGLLTDAHDFSILLGVHSGIRF